MGGKENELTFNNRSRAVTGERPAAEIPIHFPISDKITSWALTQATLDYLIRASAFPAQVAQSVEQRTENTKNPLTLSL
jgi:hypothetical protein